MHYFCTALHVQCFITLFHVQVSLQFYVYVRFIIFRGVNWPKSKILKISLEFGGQSQKSFNYSLNYVSFVNNMPKINNLCLRWHFVTRMLKIIKTILWFISISKVFLEGLNPEFRNNPENWHLCLTITLTWLQVWIHFISKSAKMNK